MKTIGQLREEVERKAKTIKANVISEAVLVTQKDTKDHNNMSADINNIPPIIILKRRSIRIFPDGQKVALYWSDKLHQYVSVPFGTFSFTEDTQQEGVLSTVAGAVGRFLKGGAQGVADKVANDVGIYKSPTSVDQVKKLANKPKVSRPSTHANNTSGGTKTISGPTHVDPKLLKNRRKTRENLKKASAAADATLAATENKE